MKPRKGMALLFWSLKPDSKTKDMRSLHGGCPVIRGDKWSATKWVTVLFGFRGRGFASGVRTQFVE